MQFVMGNTNVSIYDADPWALWVLDKELRYPTATARAQGSGWSPPGGGDGWDGWIRLLRRPKTIPPYFPTGLISTVERLCHKMQIPFQVDDVRQKPMGGIPEHPSETIIDRDYQLAAETKALQIGRGVVNMSPRSGKTRVLMSVVAKLGLHTLWTAPTDAIVRQTLRAFETFFGANFAHHQVGSSDLTKAKNARVTICTAATAVRLPPEFYKTRECKVVDEWHHGAAKTYHEIAKNCDHIYYRYGMTGTFFRSGEDDMAMHALLSNTIYHVSSAKLLAEGYLVPTRVVYVPVDAPRLRTPGDDTRVAPYLKYGIQEHDYRNQLAAYCAAYLHNQFGRKVLVLVATKEQGRRLERMIRSQLPEKLRGAQFDPVEFLSTDCRRDRQQRILKAYNESDEVRVLIGTSLLGEGVDLPPADALVYARGEKAAVTLTQNAYRVCTAFGGKKDAIIVDFADRHNKYLMSHSKQRLAMFHGDPVFSVEVLESAKYFGAWAKEINELSAVAAEG